MKNRNFFLMLIAIVTVSTSASAQDGNGGQVGAFLRRGVGGRALAMGNSYTSVANDASSIYWNAAGLSRIEKVELQGMYSILTFDRQELFVGVGGKISNLFAFGVGWYKFGVTDIDGRDRTGNPTGKFDDSENSLMASASRNTPPLAKSQLALPRRRDMSLPVPPATATPRSRSPR